VQLVNKQAANSGSVQEAEVAFAQGDFERAARMARVILDLDSGNAKAMRLALRSLASLGDARAVFALLNDMAFAGPTRLEAMKLAMRAAQKANQLTCGLALATRLTPHVGRVRSLISDVTSMVLASGDDVPVDEYLAALTVQEDRNAVSAMWDARCYRASEAVQRLDHVPKDHPLRLRAVRMVLDAAGEEHDQTVIYRLGMELLASGAMAGVPIWRIWQATLLKGLPEDVRAVFTHVEQMSNGVFESEEKFGRGWKIASNWFLHTFNIDAGLRVLDTAFERGLTTPDDHPTRDLVLEFVTEFERELRCAHQTFRALVFDEPVQFPADERVRIVSRPRITNIGSYDAVEIDRAWLKFVTAVGRQARKAGGSIGFVQIGHEQRAQACAPVPLTLSYHTTGRSFGTLHFKEADLPGYVSVDPDGYSGWASLAVQSIDELPLAEFASRDVDAFFDRMRKHTIEGNVSKYVQSRDPGGEALPNRYVFVALQTLNDRVQELACIPMLDMLDIVVRRFAGTEHRVVVKRHPLCRDRRVADRLAQLSSSGEIVVRADSIHGLIAGADAVITVNSGVGSEAAIHLKPVYIFGAAEYAPISHSIATEAEFVEKTSPIGLPVTSDSIKRFLYFYRTRWLINAFDADALQTAVATRLFQPSPGDRSKPSG
jgi:hypothetical protein